MYEIKLFPPFSWSMSRHKTLLACPRKYGYHYYFSHNGWLLDASLLTKQAFRLKQLTRLPMLFGSIIHTLIEESLTEFLEQNKKPNRELLIQRVRQSLNEAFKDSKLRRHLWTEHPKDYKMFHEIYYNGDFNPALVQQINERIDLCIDHFLQSRSFKEIISKQEMYFIEAEKFRTMRINGVLCYIVMDFVYRDIEQDKWIIVDWKTGHEREDDRAQLALYALYLRDKFHVESLKKIVIRNEYLLTGTHKEYSLTEANLTAIEQTVRMSIALMQEYVEDSKQNKPKSIESFPIVQEEGKCQSCNFRELCQTGEPRNLS